MIQETLQLENMSGLIIFLSLWEAIWTLIGLWYSARKDKWWFIGMGLIQLLGIIEIYYLVKHTSFVSDVNIYLYKKLNH
jgi:membrane protein YdbS with pleckstrin-like domain|tara:strand:+ start:772 stop:1008 length:237 start_codon:yes stop_codon:yes gene_type:complete